jgi:Zn-dependent peptidase ImmA (M78 family)
MARNRSGMAVDDQIAELLEETGEEDPREAVRAKARELIALFHQSFGGRPPFDMQALASLRGILPSSEPPAHSPDAELHPDGMGNVLLRVNRDRPRTRQRFSVGHEITHTFFSGYQDKVQCRKPKHRDWSDPEDVLEVLCDIGASELLLPMPWFAEDAVECAATAHGIVELATLYGASLEATIRRLVDVVDEPMAAVFFSWKHKPSQKKRGVGSKDQMTLFGTDPEEDARELLRLRVDYALATRTFDAHVPADKSVDSSSSIHRASVDNLCLDADEILDLGPCRGAFRISTVPLFTEEGCAGPRGERQVVAILRPRGERIRAAARLPLL